MKGKISLILVLLLWGGISDPLLAKPTPKPEVIPLTLEDITSDPLLPRWRIVRPLSEFEKSQLKQQLEQLDRTAFSLLQQKQTDQAFALYFRELQLTRYLGYEEEISQLGRIGTIAWDNSRSTELKTITQRLETIEKNIPPSDPLYPTLGIAYQQTRSLDSALRVLNTQYQQAQTENNLTAQKDLLNTISAIHLSRFDYEEAIQNYETLLAMSQQENDTINELAYLQQLSYLYQQVLQPDNALRIHQRLVETYTQQQQLENLPALYITLGDDYQALNQLESASNHYQTAFTLAWTAQQMAVAGQALQKLAELYEKNNYQDYALQVYEQLIKVQQKSYDYYGLMQTFDRMGQMYFKIGNYRQAQAMFIEGLKLAQSLNYDIDRFQNQLNTLAQIIPKL